MVLTPLSLEELCRRLNVAFAAQDGNKGTHAVLDTWWFPFLEEFSDLSGLNTLLRGSFRVSDLDVLDIGCGSSLTLFQAIEAFENQVEGIKINGYGLTASPQFLNRGCLEMRDPEMKKELLNKFALNSPAEYRRVELLFQGVQESEENGLYRFTPKGNLIRLRKGDAHYLQKVFGDQKFDVIYSSATYPLLFCPWLAFEQAANSLKKGGILLIDGIETRSIVDKTGKMLTPEEYAKMLQNANQGYKIYFKSSSYNPFYAPIIVEKRTEEDINTLLSFGTMDRKPFITQIVGVLQE